MEKSALPQRPGLYIYVYIYMYLYMYIYIYVYTHTSRNYTLNPLCEGESRNPIYIYLETRSLNPKSYIHLHGLICIYINIYIYLFIYF